MADLTDAKGAPGAVWPTGGKESAWLRTQPLIDPARLRALHLFGLPLMSAMPDPVTGKHQVISDELLQVYIERAVELVEAEIGADLMPVVVTEKHPFDRQAFEAYMLFRTNRRPVTQVIKLCINLANEDTIYTMPVEWVEMARAFEGQLNVVPMALAQPTVGGVTNNGGMVFMSAFRYQTWVPSYWTIEYVSGFKDGLVPGIVNELVGTVAAMEVLSNLATTYARSSNVSIGVDGLSQSIGSPGPELFAARLKDLGEKRAALTSRLKARFGLKFLVGDV